MTSIFEYFASDFESEFEDNLDSLNKDPDSENYYDPDKADDNVLVSSYFFYLLEHKTPIFN